MSARNRRILLAITVLAMAGIVISSVSLYHHYGTEKSSFCDFGQSFNCDMVNRSIYSSVMGVPVALIGVVGYLALLTLATVYRGKTKSFESQPIRLDSFLPKRGQTLPVRFQTPLAQLAAGRYTCQISLIDETGRKFAFQRADIVVLPAPKPTV